MFWHRKTPIEPESNNSFVEFYDQITTIRDTPNKLFDPGPMLGFPLLCSAATVEKMSMWYRSDKNHAFDTIVLRAGRIPHARVEGRLYKLTSEQLEELDNTRQIGVQFDRKLVPVFLPIPSDRKDKDSPPVTIRVWMYVGDKGYWLEEMEKAKKPFSQYDFELATRYMSPTRLLNGHFSLYPPIVEAPEERATPKVVQAVGKRNRQEFLRAFLDDIEDV